MRRYETIIIIDPDLSEEGHSEIFHKIDDLIGQYSGFLIKIDKWGSKRLAYEVKKRSRGYYVRFDFCSKVEMIQEMEHFFRINDNILKFMTILLDKEADIDVIKDTIAETNQTELTDTAELENQEANSDLLKPEDTVKEEE